MSTEIASLIERDAEIRKGRPCIAGTGITVHRIAIWYKLGHSPEEIARRYGHLTVGQIYAALAYYHSNREEIDAQLAAEEEDADRIEQEYLQHQSV